MDAARRTVILYLCLSCLLWEASGEPKPNGVLVRKGEGAPWGQYFSPGFGGYYSADDFRIEPHNVNLPALRYETFESSPDDEQQLVQGPDFSQETQGPDYGQVTQGPDLAQLTQGPDYGQVTQGPDLGQATQGPDYGQVTERPSVQQTQGPIIPDYQVTTYRPRPEIPDTQSTNEPDDEQFTTQPSIHLPTTEYPTTTDFPEMTTWRPHHESHHQGTCRPNPAAAGYPRGTKLLCTVEVCGGDGVKGGGIKGGGTKGGSIKGGHIKGIKSAGRSGLGLGINVGLHVGAGRSHFGGGHNARLATTLVCRPYYGCDDDVTIQTTVEPEYTTMGLEHTTPYPTTYWHETTQPEETTPIPTIPTPGIKGGHPHLGIKGVHHEELGIKGGHHLEDLGIKGGYQLGVKGGLSQNPWEVETLSQQRPEPEGIKGVKGVKGGRRPLISLNVPAYSGFRGHWNRGSLDRQIGLKGRPQAAVKGGYQYEAKPPAEYVIGGSGWGQLGYL